MVINQPFGIGDILYLEPLYRFFAERDKQKPIVPVRDHLFWIRDYIESATIDKMSNYSPRIFEFNEPSDFRERPVSPYESLYPARFANQILRGYDPHDHHDLENMMRDKYLLAGASEWEWLKINIKFNERKCQELLDLLIPQSWEDYVLVNNHSGAGSINIKPETDLRIIRMEEVPGYNVLDWAFVMLHAQENHHVSTSTFYILQALANQYAFKGKIFMYPRPNEDGLRGISKLVTSLNFVKCSAVK